MFKFLRVGGTKSIPNSIGVLPVVRQPRDLNAATNIPPVLTPPAMGGFQPRIPWVQWGRVQFLPTAFQLRSYIDDYRPYPAQIGSGYGAWSGMPRQYIDTGSLRGNQVVISPIIAPVDSLNIG